MLHTKFQDHRSTGSGEEDFLRFLPSGGCIRNSVPNGPMVSEEKLFIIMDGRTMEDGRQSLPILLASLEPSAQVC